MHDLVQFVTCILIHRSSSSEQFSYSDLSLVENKDNTDNNKDFSDKNDQNVNQCQVHQGRKKIRRCGICFGVGHDRRNCPQARVNRE
uniref:Uncharacterized protein n=1 Tax=Lactuca sativa TaxID=4236 RepID=A0A9R1XHD8_LACSA|nr:hypothetical protein LSAT_V11C400181020 [Lactuca sativa]